MLSPVWTATEVDRSLAANARPADPTLAIEPKVAISTRFPPPSQSPCSIHIHGEPRHRTLPESIGPSWRQSGQLSLGDLGAER